MKEFIKKIVVWKLNFLAKAYLKKYKPTIIAVTGNVGKTSTKEAIAAVLSSKIKVRSGKGNLNNEFGVPLTILGDWGDEYYEGGATSLFWVKVLFSSFFNLIFKNEYPKVLVLEYGADAPGDIKKLVGQYPPDIAVVTAVGEIPVHVEYFEGKEGLAKEKAKLVSAVPIDGHVILNHDDPLVLAMKEKTKAHVRTFGLNDNAGIKAGGSEFFYDQKGKVEGVKFKIHQGQNAYVPVVVHGSLGISQAYCVAAATAVGLLFDINLVDIAQAVSQKYHGPKGRLKIIDGVKNTTIIDDTYNAAPASTILALETLKSIKTENTQARKIAVLGDMLELGQYTIQAHQNIGNTAARSADICVFVGSRMKFAAEAAMNEMIRENIHTFSTSDEAKIKVEEMIKEGDMILIKGSQGMRMEKIVEEIMAEPEKKRELLVRQGKKWLTKI